MFKIVETIEKNKKNLTIVPSSWEENNMLSWPKYRADKLIKDINSEPDETWFKMKCKLKRSHLFNIEVAEEELERMVSKDNTEQEEMEIIESYKKRPRVYQAKRNSSGNLNDFNSLANSCTQIASITDTAEELTEAAAMDIQQTAQAIQSNFVMDESDNNNYIQQESSAIETLDSINLTDLVEKMDNILRNQELIIKNQNTLLTSNSQNLFSANIENETKIFQKLAKLETMVDLIGDKILSGDLGRSSQDQTIQRTPSFGEIEPIQNLKKLEELEQKLCNKSTMEEYIEKFCFISGTKGNGSGINSAYLLIDRMFTRKFMTLCSWAGGSRDKKEKIAFKSFKNVIGLFFRVIQLADRNFTLMDCEEFIKNIIRNSTRRSESNNTRISTTKRRPKKITYKPKEGNGSEIIENGEEEVLEVIQNESNEDKESENVNTELATNSSYLN